MKITKSKEKYRECNFCRENADPIFKMSSGGNQSLVITLCKKCMIKALKYFISETL